MFGRHVGLHPLLLRRRRVPRLEVERLEERRLLDVAASAIISNVAIELGINPQGNGSADIPILTNGGGKPVGQQTHRIRLPPGQRGSVEALSASGVGATIRGAHGAVDLIALSLDVPPIGLPTPLEGLTDVQTIGDTGGATLDATFYYPATLTPEDAQRLTLLSFEAEDNAFEKVVGIGADGKLAAPKLVMGPITVDGQTFGGYLAVTLDSTTTPNLPLLGTIFAITLSNAVTTTVVISPPTASTAPASPATAVNFTSTTQLSLALTAASTSRASAGGISPGLASSNASSDVAATAQPTTTRATGSATTAAASSGGEAPDRAPAPLSNEELLELWIHFEQTGEVLIAPQKGPAPRRPEPKAPPQTPPAPEDGAAREQTARPQTNLAPNDSLPAPELIAPPALEQPSPKPEGPTLGVRLSAAVVALWGAKPWQGWSPRKGGRGPMMTRQRKKPCGRALGLMELPSR